MDRVNTIAEYIYSRIIDEANDIATEDFQAEENIKLPLIAYSLIQAAATYTAFMLFTVHEEEGLTRRKMEFMEELQSYFMTHLGEQIDNRLSRSPKTKESKATKRDSCIINFEDYVKNK